jgi:hypothetical protein
VVDSATGKDEHTCPHHEFSKMLDVSGIGMDIEIRKIKARIKGIIFAGTERFYFA